MITITPTQQDLIQAVSELPLEVLPELADFIDYLRIKTKKKLTYHQPVTQSPSSGSNFLLSIAGIGATDDLAENDEQILANDIDSLRGWAHNRDDSP